MKTCATCSIAKPAEAYRNRYASCRDCFNARRRAARDYAAESASKREGERRNPAAQRQKALARAKKARDTMSDSYIRSKLLSEIPAQAVPQELIELKRALLMIKRELWKDTDGRE